MKKASIVIAALAALGAVYAIPAISRSLSPERAVSQGHGASIEHQEPDGVKLVAAWVHPPISLQQMVNDANVIAITTAGSAYPGRVVVSSGGLPPLEFELVDFAVDQVLKGAPPGTITVERLAGTQGGRRVTISHDGGDFAPGTRHLLFLNKQPDAPYFILLNDQARYTVQQNRLEAVTTGPVSAAVAGRTLPEVTRVIQQLAGSR